MKKQIISLSLMLNAIPFAYWPMKGVFNIPAPYLSTESPIELLKLPISVDDYKKLGYLFLYSSYGYSIGIESITESFLCSKYIDFFLGKNNINPSDSSFCLNSIDPYTKRIFYIFKEKPNLELENSKEELECLQTDWLQNSGESIHQELNKSTCNIDHEFANVVDIRKGIININSKREKKGDPKIDVNVIDIQKEFTTSSGITVRNTKDSEGKDKVVIQKGDKILDFQKELINHFNTDRNQEDLVQNILDYRYNNGSLNRVIDTAHRITNITEKEIERLKSSKILAVYAVIKTAEGKESIIWGLSEDNTPEKKRFHWITDLECDFSVLISQ